MNIVALGGSDAGMHWTNLAHRTHADLEATGITLRLDTRVTTIDVVGRRVAVTNPDGTTGFIDYDELIVGTGADPVVPPIDGLSGDNALGAADGVHLLHSMGDTSALTESLDRIQPATVLIVGAGYVGLEMAEGFTARGIAVTQVERLPEVLRPSMRNSARWYTPDSNDTASACTPPPPSLASSARPTARPGCASTGSDPAGSH